MPTRAHSFPPNINCNGPLWVPPHGLCEAPEGCSTQDRRRARASDPGGGHVDGAWREGGLHRRSEAGHTGESPRTALYNRRSQCEDAYNRDYHSTDSQPRRSPRRKRNAAPAASSTTPVTTSATATSSRRAGRASSTCSSYYRSGERGSPPPNSTANCTPLAFAYRQTETRWLTELIMGHIDGQLPRGTDTIQVPRRRRRYRACFASTPAALYSFLGLPECVPGTLAF